MISARMAANFLSFRPALATVRSTNLSILRPRTPLRVPRRNTFVLRRRVPLPILHPDTDYVNVKRKLKPLYEEYVVERTENGKHFPLVELILMKYVEDVGKPGQIVKIQPIAAYDMVVLGEALYATPENIKKVKLLSESDIENYSSLSAYKTMKALKKKTLSVFVNMYEPWTIEPWMIRVHYRLNGVHVLRDDCIELPDAPITGPNMEFEGKDFVCYININKTERFPVRCRLRHFSKIFSERVILPPDHECVPADPIFPEQAEILKSIPLPEYVEK